MKYADSFSAAGAAAAKQRAGTKKHLPEQGQVLNNLFNISGQKAGRTQAPSSQHGTAPLCSVPAWAARR